jgi:hypothetical protein
MIKTRTIAIGLATAAAAVAPAAALAKGGDDTRVRGSCSGNSTSKLKVGPDDGRHEAEFEVDQNRVGVTWKVQLRLNGKLVTSTTAKTRAPSGSFEVRRLLANRPGSDRIAAKATSPSGEVCTAAVTV